MTGDKKGDNISSVNMVCQFSFKLYSMLLHVIMDVNKDLNFFLFCVLRPAKHKRR